MGAMFRTVTSIELVGRFLSMVGRIKAMLLSVSYLGVGLAFSCVAMAITHSFVVLRS